MAMTPELQILLWWIAFGGTHQIGSSVPVRTWLIGKLGLLEPLHGLKGRLI